MSLTEKRVEEIVREVCAVAQYAHNFELSEVDVDLVADAARRTISLSVGPGECVVKRSELESAMVEMQIARGFLQQGDCDSEQKLDSCIGLVECCQKLAAALKEEP